MRNKLAIYLLLLSSHYAIAQENNDGVSPLTSDKEVETCEFAIASPSTFSPVIIVDSDDVQPSEIPWSVAVYRKTYRGVEFLCSGTVISRKLVLTAAHCYTRDPVSELVVYYGTRNLTDWINEERKVSGVREILKPNSSSDAEGDLAVLVLTSVYTYSNENHAPVAIIQQGEVDYPQHKRGWISGWESEKSAILSTAKSLLINIVDREECVKNDLSVANQATGNLNCFQYAENPKPCRAYSGSGFFVNKGPIYAVVSGLSYPAKRWYIRGVVKSVTRDEKIGECNIISVYTDLASYIPWLEEMIHKYDGIYEADISKTNEEEKKNEKKLKFILTCRDAYRREYNKLLLQCNDKRSTSVENKCPPCNTTLPQPSPPCTTPLAYPTTKLPPPLPKTTSLPPPTTRIPLLLTTPQPLSTITMFETSTEDVESNINYIKQAAKSILAQGKFDLKTLNSNLTSEEHKLVEDLKRSSKYLLHDAFQFSLSITQTLLKLNSEMDNERSTQELKLEVRTHIQQSVIFLKSVSNVLQKIHKIEEISEKTGTEVEFRFSV